MILDVCRFFLRVHNWDSSLVEFESGPAIANSEPIGFSRSWQQTALLEGTVNGVRVDFGVSG